MNRAANLCEAFADAQKVDHSPNSGEVRHFRVLWCAKSMRSVLNLASAPAGRRLKSSQGWRGRSIMSRYELIAAIMHRAILKTSLVLRVEDGA